MDASPVVAASVFDTIFGLPVHSLVVHAVVVLLPIAALGAVAMAVRPAWSQRYGLLVVAVAAACTPAAWVAIQSGEQLAGRVGWPAPHVALGRTVIWFALGLLATTVLLWWRDRSTGAGVTDRGRTGTRTTAGRVIAAVVVVVAVASGVQTVRAGHSGSEAVWGSIIDSTTPGSQPEPAWS